MRFLGMLQLNEIKYIDEESGAGASNTERMRRIANRSTG